MSLSPNQSNRIAAALKLSLLTKLKSYKPEANYMPFHTRLLGTDRMALFSFIHSLNTNFGTTVFEPVAVELARSKFKFAASKYSVGNLISETAQHEIQRIMDGLTTATSSPDKPREVERLRKVATTGEMISAKPTLADLAVGNDEEIYLFDLKTAKPNIGDFQKFKRMFLEWSAISLAKNPERHVHTALAIPYNPYYPAPYKRWTIRGMIDLKRELFVAEDFWDFLGGAGAFESLLTIFEKVGIELRTEIDDAFSKFK